MLPPRLLDAGRGRAGLGLLRATSGLGSVEESRADDGCGASDRALFRLDAGLDAAEAGRVSSQPERPSLAHFWHGGAPALTHLIFDFLRSC